jgi:hypothetical protein
VRFPSPDDRRFPGPIQLGSRFYQYPVFTGQSPENIAQAFPVLTLEQVYGAVTFYLARRDEVDRYLETRRQAFEAARKAVRNTDPVFYQRLAEARKPAHFPHGDPPSEER